MQLTGRMLCGWVAGCHAAGWPDAVRIPTNSTLWDTAKQIVDNEQNYGNFEEWSIDQKTALIASLADLSYVEKNMEVGQLLGNELTELEAHLASDSIVTGFTGVDSSEVSFFVIMESALGPFDGWAKEDQARYSQLMIDTGIQRDDHTLYVEPNGSVDETQAISIARREIAKGYGVPEEDLDKYSVNTSFQVPEFTESEDARPYWYVEYTAPDSMPEEERLFIQFWLFIHPETGVPLESVDSILATRNTLPEQFSHEFYDAEKTLFDQANSVMLWDRTLEQKAEYSKTIRPIVQTMLDSGDLSVISFDGQVDNSILAASTYAYGLPDDDDDIVQEKAYELAIKAVQDAYGLDDDIIGLYKAVSTYFDITNPEKPLWKFLFRPETWRDFEKGLDDPQYSLRYRVEMDARTGEIAKVEEFEFATKDGTNLEYELKWY